ncbi:MAG: SIMPL domain-containing protein [Selenomonadaceae bacterium]|nr:SIMPL domain-containing protein [Selenomonadaceae bacterium]MDY2685872.1 SIMPL domain-containing protein [Selenomonadaceae bacterium]
MFLLHKTAKIPMLLAAFCLMAGITAASVPPACAAAEASVLSVDGQASAEQEPDRAIVSIGVTTQAGDAAKAQAENARKAQAIHQAVSALGIADQDIETQNYSFYPVYTQTASHQNKITGYRVDNTIVVTINRISLTGKVIDTSLASGANEISSLDFGAKDVSNARNAALKKAVLDARSKAEVLASALGMRIVGIKNVSENVSNPGTRRYTGNLLMMAKSDAAPATPVEAGTLRVTANVHIDFLLSK